VTPATTKNRVPLAKLTSLDGSRDLHPPTVDEYADCITASATDRSKGLPLALVGKLPDGSFVIIDGGHRMAAAKKAGRDKVGVEIVPVADLSEAMWLSAGMNTMHGLRRTNKAKRQAVLMALKARPDVTTNELVDHCRVSRPIVQEIHYTFDEERRAPRPKNLGRAEETPKEAKAPQEPTHSGDTTESGGAKPATRMRRDGRVITLRPKPENPKVPVDHKGNPVPDKLAPIFARADEVNGIMREVSALKGKILKLAEKSDDPIWGKLDGAEVKAILGRTYDIVKAAMPYAVCGGCRGGEAGSGAKCKACGGAGWLNVYAYHQEAKEIHV